jgi:DNA-binding transcriptional regulator YhcF (GntR family)
MKFPFRRNTYAFTDGCRFALAAARDEAARLGHDFVGTEHLLVGLMRYAEPQRGGAAFALGLRVEDVRRELGDAVVSRVGVFVPRKGELPYTSRAKKVLEYAMDEARLLEHAYVGTDHLLLGLLREEHGIAAIALRQLGVTLESARQQVRASADAQPGAARDVGTANFQIAIDDASDRSIHEQIVARVQEAVATGTLRPGERMPTVRRLADDLDIAPGTVARAYGELERLGVVVTEGARGTRVADAPATAREGTPDPAELLALLRPAAVKAFHMGATAADLRAALEEAMKDIFAPPPPT